MTGSYISNHELMIRATCSHVGCTPGCHKPWGFGSLFGPKMYNRCWVWRALPPRSDSYLRFSGKVYFFCKALFGIENSKLDLAKPRHKWLDFLSSSWLTIGFFLFQIRQATLDSGSGSWSNKGRCISLLYSISSPRCCLAQELGWVPWVVSPSDTVLCSQCGPFFPTFDPCCFR